MEVGIIGENMAKIEIAIVELFGHEGVYDNDPDDTGGETVYGVARNMHPNLSMWDKVDEIKKNHVGKKAISQAILQNKDQLLSEIYYFYTVSFWDVFDCDNLPQQIANEVFEQSVNIGVFHCTKNIQKAVNLLNRDESLWEDISVDGKPGPGTKKALMKACEGDQKYLFGILNILQGARYVEIGKEKYIRGWIKRAQWVY